MIFIHVDPNTPPMSWDDFAKTHVPYAIALDGYVAEGPKVDVVAPRANFNHHEGCNRMATRATCGQILMAIRQGLFKLFRKDGVPEAAVYVSDCDEDVCTSWFLIKNHAWSQQPLNPLLNRLVMMEDALDASAGAYPFPADLPILGELAWVFEPYRQFRTSGGLEKHRNAGTFRSIIEDVTNRIERHITGHGQSIPLDTRYERLGGGNGWALVREIGPQARTQMFADGISAFISVRERGEGKYTYTVGRISQFIPFDCDAMYRALNEAEGKVGGDVWGGADTVGGSPRVSGSALSPEEVTRIVNEVLGKKV